jgi:hypothetical protein
VGDDGSQVVDEQICRFGAQEQLFGILSRTSDDPGRPAIVMFNAGSVHHVGPHRLYVTLARELALLGFASLRFDLEGIGDSVLTRAGRENHPYPDTAIADTRAALDFLHQRFGYRRFIGLGLCSGAHTAFHAALALPEHPISKIVLINPLTFYWQEGMSLATVEHFFDVVAYRKSMRDPRRWMRLLRGEADIRRPIEVALAHARNLARSQWDGLLEAVWPDKGPRLSRDLRKLFAMNRRMVLLVSEGDPGYELVQAGARRAARGALESGEMEVEWIAEADHTFSQVKPRAELARRLVERLRPLLRG